jgi:hypothetical protein
MAGGSSIAAMRSPSLLMALERTHKTSQLPMGHGETAAICLPYGKIPILSLML